MRMCTCRDDAYGIDCFAYHLYSTIPYSCKTMCKVNPNDKNNTKFNYSCLGNMLLGSLYFHKLIYHDNDLS